MNAAELRAKFQKPYMLCDILVHAESVADRHQAIRGYQSSRLTDAVATELRHLGFTLTNNRDEVVISWKEENPWRGEDAKESVS